MTITKKFYEEKTGRFFKTLKAAKFAPVKYPYIYRVWVDENENKILGKCVVHAYGDSVGTIASADNHIAEELAPCLRNSNITSK